MKIIIAGSGEVGQYLTNLLSKDGHEITVVDINKDKIEYISTHYDVSCVFGKSSCPDILRQAGSQKADLLIACTDSDENNILTSVIGKKLGVEKTISRIKSDNYSQIDLGIDDIVTTSELAANEIKRLLNGDITDSFEFDGGLFNLIGLKLDVKSCLVDKYIGDVKYDDMKLAAILRDGKTILPDEKVKLKSGDHIYFLSKHDNVENIENVCGKKHIICKNIIINGINEITENLVRVLKDVNIKVFEKDASKCSEFMDKFDNCLVVNSLIDLEIMDEEGVNNYDCIISVTRNTETNIISSLFLRTTTRISRNF